MYNQKNYFLWRDILCLPQVLVLNPILRIDTVYYLK